MVLTERQNQTASDFTKLQTFGKNSVDPYVQSLVALSYYNLNNVTLAFQMSEKLKVLMNLSIPLQKSSLVNSNGDDQLVEYKSFAVLALLNINTVMYGPQIQQNVE